MNMQTTHRGGATRRRAIGRILLMAGAAAILGACEERGADKAVPRTPGPLRIAVSVPPLAGLVRALAPSDAEITILMAPGRSEHGYEFTPGDLARMGKADMVAYVGLGLEPRIEKFLDQNPSPRRVDFCLALATGVLTGAAGSEAENATGVVMKGEPGQRHDYGGKSAEGHAQDQSGNGHGDRDDHDHDDHSHSHDHDHDHDHDHGHGAVDPHLWLDPVLVLNAVPALALAIGDAARHAGINPGDLEARQNAVVARLSALDEQYRSTLAPHKGAAIVTHHNAWGRLADRYGLVVAAVVREVEAGEPTPGAIAASVDAIRQRAVKTVFVEPQFNPDAARRIAESAGVGVGMLDPLGDGDYFAMMEGNLERLAAGLGGR